MLESHKIYLHDRIKETSYTIGTGNFTLNGAANGFSSFGSVYENGENVFYAATDGTFYEIGSGVYVTGVQNSLKRFPFRSSNNNAIVSFGEGLKEIFATYPATNSVYSASGLQGFTQPKQSGISFWSSSNILNYDSNIVWDSGHVRLGIRSSSPSFAIDIGGSSAQSIIRCSGFYVSNSGVIFPSGNNGDSSYTGGTQLAHYEPNLLNSITGSDQILELSGVAKNHILLKKQNAGLVFAGPSSGCTPPCSPDYPSFRPLFVEDIHDLNAEVVLNGSGLRVNQYVSMQEGCSSDGVFVLNSSDSVGYSLYTSSSGTNFNIGVGNPSGTISGVLSLSTDTLGVANSTLDFYGKKLRIRNSFTPSTSSSPGNSGEICWDSGYLYICIAPSSWVRTSLSTW